MRLSCDFSLVQKYEYFYCSCYSVVLNNFDSRGSVMTEKRTRPVKWMTKSQPATVDCSISSSSNSAASCAARRGAALWWRDRPVYQIMRSTGICHSNRPSTDLRSTGSQKWVFNDGASINTRCHSSLQHYILLPLCSVDRIEYQLVYEDCYRRRK